ncbi:hypothetical protein [Solitalea lacus]|uniref:hypothetical protein n=1 Tax=Solitalea lacus TaxID=2911172 RepID=UPI001EDAA1BC|nr:hypothetical protein [Solitalea lacus]UKJ08662.1 hypothetical protein L2B55_05705 [Solitalea lacus]
MENENVEIGQPVVLQSASLSDERITDFTERKKAEQNLFGGIMGCVVAAFVGAIIWAAITVLTNYQIGYMAVGVGFLIGYANRVVGRGIDVIFGIIGAVFALIGCLMGNFFSAVAVFANQENVSYIQILVNTNMSIIVDVLTETFGVIDLLFYAIAVYQGYRFSFRQFTEEELSRLNA